MTDTISETKMNEKYIHYIKMGSMTTPREHEGYWAALRFVETGSLRTHREKTLDGCIGYMNAHADWIATE